MVIGGRGMIEVPGLKEVVTMVDREIGESTREEGDTQDSKEEPTEAIIRQEVGILMDIRITDREIGVTIRQEGDSRTKEWPTEAIIQEEVETSRGKGLATAVIGMGEDMAMADMGMVDMATGEMADMRMRGLAMAVMRGLAMAVMRGLAMAEMVVMAMVVLATAEGRRWNVTTVGSWGTLGRIVQTLLEAGMVVSRDSRRRRLRDRVCRRMSSQVLSRTGTRHPFPAPTGLKR
jgi:hypothetical protein